MTIEFSLDLAAEDFVRRVHDEDAAQESVLFADDRIGESRVERGHCNRARDIDELGPHAATADSEEEVVAALLDLDGQLDVAEGVRVSASGNTVDIDHRMPTGVEEHGLCLVGNEVRVGVASIQTLVCKPPVCGWFE